MPSREGGPRFAAGGHAHGRRRARGPHRGAWRDVRGGIRRLWESAEADWRAHAAHHAADIRELRTTLRDGRADRDARTDGGFERRRGAMILVFRLGWCLALGGLLLASACGSADDTCQEVEGVVTQSHAGGTTITFPETPEGIQRVIKEAPSGRTVAVGTVFMYCQDEDGSLRRPRSPSP